MNNNEIKKDIIDECNDLYKLLTDRIGELHNLSGASQGQFYQGARHTFIFYRDYVDRIKTLAEQIKQKEK